MPDNVREGCAPSECGTKSACQGCSSNPNAQQVKKDPPKVKKVIGVISGKGGVGKSLVSGELAVMLRRLGLSVGIMDADITGPSIPHMFGVREKAMGTDTQLFPVRTTNDIEMMSINLMLETDDTPVIWRGPVIAGVVTQFWEDVAWGELDCMVIDMPPGTGDVPLTVFQSIPLDGVVIVTTPQDLVGMIVRKAVNMAKMMNIPVLGLVENMSYAICPDCGKHIEIFGKSGIDELAAQFSIPVLAKLPIDPTAASLCDEGKIERVVNPQMEDAARMLAGNFGLL
ncbi:MAG: Mrp/NBP35 family ATP-binding protein [Clostridia bacterium]|nr:Mrp/NBP35 family ATP-binding protein [Clostridia bacterium]